jgi:hypothetical protein
LAASKGNLSRAVAEYRASLDIIDSPNSRLELARSLRDNGQLVDAWTEYSRTVDDAKTLAASEARYGKTAEAAALERGEVEAKIAIVTVTVEDPPPGANLRIDATLVPNDTWSKPFPVLPVAQGSIDVVLLADGAEIAKQTVPAGAGQKAAVTLSGKPAAPVATLPEPMEAAPHSEFEPVQTTPSAEGPAPSSSTRLRPFAYIAGGVGLAGIATFAISGAMSHSTFNDLQAKCHGVCPPGNEGEISSGRTQQTVANVGLVIGALGVASGVGLFIMSLPHRQQSSTTALVVGPAWLGVEGSL